MERINFALPFFLENAGFFGTPNPLFFSRRIAQPQAGARLTGRADKWAYAASMPIIPFLEVGLTPFFQLALLSLATFMILKKFSQTA